MLLERDCPAEAEVEALGLEHAVQVDALVNSAASESPALDSCGSKRDAEIAAPSRFEELFTTRPPITEALLLHLPTPSVLDLYHTNRGLRRFLKSYPLAWKNLSFRQLAPELQSVLPPSGSGSPNGSYATTRPYALDLLLRVLLPHGTCLTRLELDNTSVSGSELYSRILTPRRSSLKHLSVRGCKDVSLKYHILPFLQLEMVTPAELVDETPLALKSLYTYRCRHHRRRPYLPTSLSRRDSDSQPTHQLIQMCHYLGIWTDTGWCSTPGPRCFRRKDYSVGRIALDRNIEIWVPFDRLWRSQNFLGRYSEGSDGVESDWRSRLYTRKHDASKSSQSVRLWEEREYGYCGEPLGAGISSFGEGKETPAHLRQSHRVFVEAFKCHACGDKIHERCEQCSILMHCVGCRRTLCASCAFDKPIARKRRKMEQRLSGSAQTNASVVGSQTNVSVPDRRDSRRERERFWWAPGAVRSPNIIKEDSSDDEDDSDTDAGQGHGNPDPHRPPVAPKISTKWCCQEPNFSGGGGVSFVGTWYGDTIRAAPLPRGQDYGYTAFPVSSSNCHACDASQTLFSSGDQDQFSPPTATDAVRPHYTTNVSDQAPNGYRGKPVNIIPFLERSALESTLPDRWQSPRNLCNTCYESSGWSVPCAAEGCQTPICIEHDVKPLRVRQCGYRALGVEQMALRRAKLLLQAGKPLPKSQMWSAMRVFRAKWKPIAAAMQQKRLWRDRSDYPTLGSTESLANPSIPPSASFTTELDLTSTELISSSLTASPDHASNTCRSRSSSTTRIRSTSLPSDTLSFGRLAARDDISVLSSTCSPPPNLINTTLSGPFFAGCLRLFCPETRTAGDSRPVCTGAEDLVECSRCSVFACFDCAGLKKSCTCSACLGDRRTFLCPGCEGDWEMSERVRRKREAGEPLEKDEGWWRCRWEQQHEELLLLLKRREEAEEETRNLFEELPIGLVAPPFSFMQDVDD